MKSKPWLVSFLLLAMFSLACSLGGLLPSNDSLSQTATAVSATQQALILAQTSQAPAVSEAASGTGSLSGHLSYPSEFIPALRVVAINTQTQAPFFVDTQENLTTYQINNLPEGSYHVIAYYAEMNLAGAYSQFVLCGLSASCTDHSLVEVAVHAGQTTENVDPGDWYAPPGTFPANPVP